MGRKRKQNGKESCTFPNLMKNGQQALTTRDHPPIINASSKGAVEFSTAPFPLFRQKRDSNGAESNPKAVPFAMQNRKEDDP
jgi:hypothetical protein